MSRYEEKLLHPLWQRKRLEILSRDHFTCLLCGDVDTTFHVHHKKYLPGRKPWEYEDDNFQTLCKHCHSVAERAKGFQGVALMVSKYFEPAIGAYVLKSVIDSPTGIDLFIFSYYPITDELSKAISFSEDEVNEFQELISKAKKIQYSYGERSGIPVLP